MDYPFIGAITSFTLGLICIFNAETKATILFLCIGCIFLGVMIGIIINKNQN